MKDDIAVLGGDVYVLNSDSIEPTYANWHFDQNDNETKNEFNLRSKKESLNYIGAYKFVRENTFFSIVFSELVG